MPYYPAFLDLQGRRGIVVGGGVVAERKARSLLEAGALVTVIAPKLCPGLQRLARDGGIVAHQREYRPGDLQGAFLVMAATDEPTVNEAVSQEAQEQGILANVADNPRLCSFIVPSVVRRGDLLVAISTGGRSPALAKRLRVELEARFPAGYEHLLALISAVRDELRQNRVHIPPERWQEALTPELEALALRGAEKEAAEYLWARLLQESPAKGR
ncbi:MAG: bifunctional precorrin-2 dehydrogenase/sirohydrochlorin ferrochelatase [Chloroflexi bacterium]|nr:bifunctional precorrin-2 dehydrogenase/sirohydrochlorin ferrochelatase [Chloroflexota bacterium]